jgi:hypothetical protein
MLSVGENTALSCCVPADRTVPTAGLYVNLPGTLAFAFNCVALRAVPGEMDPGVTQVITGVAWLTIRCTDADVAEYAVSVGVKLTDIVCHRGLALNTVPARGVYTKVPDTFAVAFSSVLLSAVPYVIAGGVFQVMVGTPPVGTDAGLTTSEVYTVVEE